MGIPAHSSSVPVSAVGAAAAQESRILPTVQHDSQAEVGDKRPAPDSAEELPVPSVGVLPLHMIEEETAGEDMIAEETADVETDSVRQRLKLGVTVVRGERGGVLVHHYSSKKNAHLGETEGAEASVPVSQS